MSTCPDCAGWARPEDHGTVGPNVASDVAINAAFAFGNVYLQPGVIYGVKAPVLIPSNRTLWLNGATILTLSDFVNDDPGGPSTINAPVASRDTVGIAVLGPGIIDGNKVGLGMGAGARKCGVQMLRAQNFLCEGYIVRNCTAYANFAQGTGSTFSSGVFRRIDVYNSQMHFEQMQCKGVTVEDCRSFDGDGDIDCASWLHPVFNDAGCEEIHFVRHTGVGNAASPILIQTNNVLVQKNISFTDIDHQVDAGQGFVVTGDGGHQGIRATRCRISVPGGIGASISKAVDVVFNDVLFRGKAMPFQFANSKIDLNQCILKAAGDPGQTIYGIASTSGDTASEVRLLDPRFDLTPAGGALAHPIASKHVWVERAEILGLPRVLEVPNGTTYFRPAAWQNGKTAHFRWVGNFQYLMLPDDAKNPLPLGYVINAVNRTAGVSEKRVIGDGSPTIIGAINIAPWGLARAEKVAANTWAISGNVS